MMASDKDNFIMLDFEITMSRNTFIYHSDKNLNSVTSIILQVISSLYKSRTLARMVPRGRRLCVRKQEYPEKAYVVHHDVPTYDTGDRTQIALVRSECAILIPCVYVKPMKQWITS